MFNCLLLQPWRRECILQRHCWRGTEDGARLSTLWNGMVTHGGGSVYCRGAAEEAPKVGEGWVPCEMAWLHKVIFKFSLWPHFKFIYLGLNVLGFQPYMERVLNFFTFYFIFIARFYVSKLYICTILTISSKAISKIFSQTADELSQKAVQFLNYTCINSTFIKIHTE